MHLAKWPDTSHHGGEDAPEQEDAQPDVSLTTLSKAQPGGAALSKSFVSPSLSHTINAKVFSTESDKHHKPVKILQSLFGFVSPTF